MIIPLGMPSLTPSSDLTRKPPTGRGTSAPLFDLAPRRVWLFSLRRLPWPSRSRCQAQCPGHSLCSTVPCITAEGRYPLRYPMESGLSSPAKPRKALWQRSSAKPQICLTLLAIKR